MSETQHSFGDTTLINGQTKSRIREVSPVMALASLRSCICPACGQNKPARKSLCQKCYFSLPTGLQQKLYRRMGHGYEPAIRDALNHLGAQGIQMGNSAFRGSGDPLSPSPGNPGEGGGEGIK